MELYGLRTTPENGNNARVELLTSCPSLGLQGLEEESTPQPFDKDKSGTTY